jgi:hypothetical protein
MRGGCRGICRWSGIDDLRRRFGVALARARRCLRRARSLDLIVVGRCVGILGADRHARMRVVFWDFNCRAHRARSL